MNKMIIATSLLLVLFGVNSLAFAQKTGEDYAKEAWERVQKTVMPEEETQLALRPNMDNSKYWNDLYLLCWVEFFGTFEQVPEDQIESFAKTYAGFLNTKGPDADIRWTFSCLPFASNNESMFNTKSEKQLTPAHRKFSCAFNKEMIEQSLASPEYYRSMYYITMWARPHFLMLRNQERIDSIKWAADDIAESLFLPNATLSESDPEYWCKARVFLSICYLCCWDRSFGNYDDHVNHDYLKKEFGEFRKFYENLSKSQLFFNSVDFGNSEGMRYNVHAAKLPPFEFPSSPVAKLSIPFTKAGQEVFILYGFPLLYMSTETIKQKIKDGWK